VNSTRVAMLALNPRHLPFRFSSLLLALALVSGSFLLVGCEESETRVARYRRAVYSDTARKKEHYVATVNQGERVELVRTEGENGEESLIRMAGGKEAWIESKHLMQDAGVLLEEDVTLFVRPSATSGEAASDKHLDQADVVYVIEREENPEGEWLHVEGGGRGDFFRGWLRADAPLSFELDVVAVALRLETAVDKQDRETLDELAGKSGAIGTRAAAALVELEPEEGEEAEEGDGQSGDAESGAEANGSADNDESAADINTAASEKPAQ